MTSYHQVRVLSVTHVHSEQTLNASPLAAVDHTIKLSFLDSFHVATGAIQRLFFYEGPDLPPFPCIVTSLRSSLAATLPVFLPLAGELTFRPSSGDVVLDCSPSAVSSGVKFVEAEFSGGPDAMRRLSADDEHDVQAFARLVPDLDDGKLPAPVLAVQVTRPSGDGGGVAVVAVGVSVHHAVADGKSFWQFMKWWSAASHGGSLTAPPGLVPPTFDRTAIRHTSAEELTAWVLRLRAPMLPTLAGRSSTATPTVTPRRRRRTFVLSTDQIQSLKRRILQQLSKPASAYVSISSLAWTCIIGAKVASQMIHTDDDVYLMVNADCRGRFRGPSMDEGFFGNCVRPCYARARAGDLMPRGRLGEDANGLVHAAGAIQEAIHKGVDALGDNPFSDFRELLEYHMSLPAARMSTVGSSHRFMAYETDFGWGAPSRVELVSMFGNSEMVALLGAGDDGGVQVSVSLHGACMDAFMDDFVGIAGGLGEASAGTG